VDEPDEEPTQAPTTSTEQAESKGQSMGQKWVGIAGVSILLVVAIAIVAMELTGLIDIGAVVPGGQFGEFLGIGLIVILLIVVLWWGWQAIAASSR